MKPTNEATTGIAMYATGRDTNAAAIVWDARGVESKMCRRAIGGGTAPSRDRAMGVWRCIAP